MSKGKAALWGSLSRFLRWHHNEITALEPGQYFKQNIKFSEFDNP